jgi:poly-gamma-glutamate synthesis protein (capsule biosynthesis protein)
MPQQQVTFAAVGDIMLDHEVSRLIETRGPDFPFLNVAEILNSVDILFGNLETPLTRCQQKVIWDFSKCGLTGKSTQIFLKGSPLAAMGLKNVGFKVVSVANNHILDYGTKGLSDTLNALRENGILPVGFGQNTREAIAPRLLEVLGVRFAFFACSWAYEATFFSPGATPIRLRMLKKAVKKAREISDIVVVSLHLGIEFDKLPTTPTIRLARTLIETGADLVLCHHPHTLQKIEIYKKGLIAYSLGNFVFDYGSFSTYTSKENTERSKQSIILKCTMSKSGLIDYSVIPVWLSNKLQPTVIPSSSKLGKTILAQVKVLQSPRSSTIGIGERRHSFKQPSSFVDGLAAILKRKDFKSLYILFEKTLERIHMGNFQ